MKAQILEIEMLVLFANVGLGLSILVVLALNKGLWCYMVIFNFSFNIYVLTGLWKDLIVYVNDCLYLLFCHYTQNFYPQLARVKIRYMYVLKENFIIQNHILIFEMGK